METDFDDKKLRKYATMANWTPDVSDYIGFFPQKRKGNQCIWTCRWHTSKGLVSPATMGMNLNTMPIEYIFLEVQDLANRGCSYSLSVLDNFYQFEDLKSKPSDNEYYNKYRKVIADWYAFEKKKIVEVLGLRRCDYVSYYSFWDAPASAEGIAIRTDWY